MTPEQLEQFGYRVLAVVPRAPRGEPLDRAAAEVGILIGTLCKTLAEAESLTAHLTTLRWRKWDFAALRSAALQFRAGLGASPEPTSVSAANDWGLPPDEFAALTARAKRSGRDLYLEYEAAHDEAEQLVNALPAAKLAALMELCRADFIGYMTDPANGVGHLHGRSMERPALDINARDIALSRMYRHILFRRPLMEPWSTHRGGKTNPGPGSTKVKDIQGLKRL